VTALDLVIAGLIAALVTFVIGFWARWQYDQHVPPAPPARDDDGEIRPTDPRTEDNA